MYGIGKLNKAFSSKPSELGKLFSIYNDATDVMVNYYEKASTNSKRNSPHFTLKAELMREKTEVLQSYLSSLETELVKDKPHVGAQVMQLAIRHGYEHVSKVFIPELMKDIEKAHSLTKAPSIFSRKHDNLPELSELLSLQKQASAEVDKYNPMLPYR